MITRKAQSILSLFTFHRLTRNFSLLANTIQFNSTDHHYRHCLTIKRNIQSRSMDMSTRMESECRQRRVTSDIFKQIFTPELLTLQKLCERNDVDVRIAGGAVRDILLDIVPHDIDFATTAHPKRMVQVFTMEEIRMLEYGERAIEHGTVTVRINDTVSSTQQFQNRQCTGRNCK